MYLAELMALVSDRSRWHLPARISQLLAGWNLVPVHILLWEDMSCQHVHRPLTEPAVLEITTGPNQASDPSTGPQQMGPQVLMSAWPLCSSSVFRFFKLDTQKKIEKFDPLLNVAVFNEQRVIKIEAW